MRQVGCWNYGSKVGKHYV